MREQGVMNEMEVGCDKAWAEVLWCVRHIEYSMFSALHVFKLM